MFTGIIQAVGVVSTFNGEVLLIDPAALPLGSLEMGESIAVNGCCLTVVSSESGLLRFDLSPETVAKTSFSQLRAGSRVNLERAMQASSRFGGHIVQGHVDGVGEVVSITPNGNSIIYRFRVPNAKYLIEKGSITLDGISLTVVDLIENEFNVWTIPHTIANTHLGDLQPGSMVNVEYDMVAKYLEKLALPYLV
jgi:riboflavin synthase